MRRDDPPPSLQPSQDADAMPFGHRGPGNIADERTARAVGRADTDGSNSYPTDEDDAKPGYAIAGLVGAALLVALVGAVGYGIYSSYTIFRDHEPAIDPATGKTPSVTRLRPANQVPLAVDAPAADGSRYVGALDTYALSGLDAARRLVALHNTQQANLLDMCDDIENGTVRRPGKAATIGNPGVGRSMAPQRPGPGCTVAEVQQYLVARGLMFPDLPNELVWSYNSKTGEMYLGLAVGGSAAPASVSSGTAAAK